MANQPTKRAAAVLTIKDAPAMTQKGAKEIATWLRRQAAMLEKPAERKALADRFRARYLYTE